MKKLIKLNSVPAELSEIRGLEDLIDQIQKLNSNGRKALLEPLFLAKNYTLKIRYNSYYQPDFQGERI
jgi:hypothetical protein